MDRYNLQYPDLGTATQNTPAVDQQSPLSLFVRSYWLMALSILVVVSFIVLIYKEGSPPFSNFVRLPGWLFIGIAKYAIVIITSPVRVLFQQCSAVAPLPKPELPIVPEEVPVENMAVKHTKRSIINPENIQTRELESLAEAFENVDIIQDNINRYDPNSEDVMKKRPAHYVAMMGSSMKADFDMVEATGGVYNYM